MARRRRGTGSAAAPARGGAALRRPAHFIRAPREFDFFGEGEKLSWTAVFHSPRAPRSTSAARVRRSGKPMPQTPQPTEQR